MMGQASARLQQMVDPAVTALGYELVGIEHLPQGRHSLLRIYIDAPDGITVDDCERVSRQVSALFDVEDPIQGHYTLEVSSPGLDRPLFTAAHYERFAGSDVQLRLFAPRDGRRKYKGRLLGMREGQVVVVVDDVEQAFALEEIEKAQLVPHW
jgi:ribosome maturation factor RimP